MYKTAMANGICCELHAACVRWPMKEAAGGDEVVSLSFTIRCFAKKASVAIDLEDTPKDLFHSVAEINVILPPHPPLLRLLENGRGRQHGCFGRSVIHSFADKRCTERV